MILSGVDPRWMESEATLIDVLDIADEQHRQEVARIRGMTIAIAAVMSEEGNRNFRDLVKSVGD